MKNTAPLLFLLLFACCKQEKQSPPPEQRLQKGVTYEIFAARKYAGTQVQNTKVELRLQMHIINDRTGEQGLVWDSILPVRSITDFPLYDNRIRVLKTYPVLNSHQKLNGSCAVIYCDGDFVSQQRESGEAGPGTDSVTLLADL